MDFYILDKNETVLYVRNDAISAVHSEDELLFKATFPVDASKPIDRGQLIAFYDLDGSLQLFEIRKASPVEPDHVVDIVADYAAYAELCDEVITDVRPTNKQAGPAVSDALTGSRWTLGNTITTATLSATFYYTSRWDALRAIKETWGVALRFRWVLGSTSIAFRYVDVLARLGSARGKRFEIDKDILSARCTYDDTGVYTRLYGRGKGEEVGTSNSGDPAYGRRITIADAVWTTPTNPANKPDGQEWIEDTAATAAYGRCGRPRVGVAQFDDCTDPEELMQKTWDRLQEVKTPRFSMEATVQDLESLWGYTHEAVRLGDDVGVIVQPLSVELSASVVKLARDLLYPEQTAVTIGTYRPDSTDLQAKAAADAASAAAMARMGADVAASNPNLLQGVLDTMVTSIISSGTNRYTDPADGGDVYESADGTKAVKLTGGGILIASSKTAGVWNWATALTGAGIVADTITTGFLSCARLLGGILTLGGASNGNGYEVVKDASGNDIVILDNNGHRIFVPAFSGAVAKAAPFVVHDANNNADLYNISIDNTNAPLEPFKTTHNLYGSYLKLESDTPSYGYRYIALSSEEFAVEVGNGVQSWVLTLDTGGNWGTGAHPFWHSGNLGFFCELRLNGSVSVANSTDTLIPWDREVYDAMNMHDTANPSRITIPQVGLYIIEAQAIFAQNATGTRAINIRKNGSVAIARSNSPAAVNDSTNLDAVYVGYFNAGDYVEIILTQTSGVTLNTVFVSGQTPQISAAKIG